MGDFWGIIHQQDTLHIDNTGHKTISWAIPLQSEGRVIGRSLSIRGGLYHYNLNHRVKSPKF